MITLGERPTLAEQLSFCTTRILTRKFADPTWSGVGTGFFWTFPVEGGEVSLVITNKHVLEGANEIAIRFQEVGPNGERALGAGREVQIGFPEFQPIPHPDETVDLVAFPIGPCLNRAKTAGWTPWFISLSRAELPTADELEALDAIVDVLMVGYPNGIHDPANNLPVTRRGITAVPPWVNYQGRTDLLCDMAVFGGSSGSPVFVSQTGAWTSRKGGTMLGGNRLFLLGVLYAGHCRSEEGAITRTEVPTAFVDRVVVQQMINLAICVKAERVAELIDLCAARLGMLEIPPKSSASDDGLQPIDGAKA